MLGCVQRISAQIKYSIPEQANVGSVVGNIAKDLGLDISTLEERQFRIVSGADDVQFKVNPSNGALYVHETIDRERLCESISPCIINLKMVAENPMEIHYVGVEITDVNDNSPIFLEKQKVFEISESTPPGRRFQLPTAHDPDVALNAVRLYKLTHNEHFSLQIRERGEIRVKGAIDFEEADVFKLDVQASDKGHPPMSSDCRVIIKVLDENDNRPEIEVTSLSKQVSENSKPGT
ncbi:hypothetical protein XENOCAPTIV_027157, partial [Xenoophorus captivus]